MKPSKAKDYKNWRKYVDTNKLCIVCSRPRDTKLVKCSSCASKHKQNYIENYTKYRNIQLKKNYKVKEKLFAKYGGKCVCCGESRLGCLQLDHINNDGNKHREAIGMGLGSHGVRGGASFYSKMLKLTRIDVELQILCANCHMLKNCKYEAYFKSTSA